MRARWRGGVQLGEDLVREPGRVMAGLGKELVKWRDGGVECS